MFANFIDELVCILTLRNIMNLYELPLKGAWVVEPALFNDTRGVFFEWFQGPAFTEKTGISFNVKQANCSISGKGVIRGIHFAGYPPGQAKFVTCLTGSVFDVLVDLRIGSSTFGKWKSVIIDSRKPKVVYIPSGIGHAFMSLEEKSTFIYLCDQNYNPSNEFDLNALDGEINISWPDDIEIIQSDKDRKAPNLKSILHNLPHLNSIS